MKSATSHILTIAFFFIVSSCGKNDPTPTPLASNDTLLYGTGWNSTENFTQTIPVAINYGNYVSGGGLPSSVDLTSKFPPVEFQGGLGTCVAWAIGYNTKSYLDAISKNLSPAELQYSYNQYSPTDLFFSIDQSRRWCDRGTNFDDAFSVLINRGVNTLADVPYDEICRSSSPGSPATAAANKIKNYRRIDGSLDEVKQYLAQGIPVVMGSMVNMEFQRWRGSGVMTNINYTGDELGHAMVIAGYDDGRGAFRIINSWSTQWGDYGYAWIDYNFLLNKLCIQGGQKSLFVAFNDNTTTITPPATVTGGPDLTALVMSDFTLYPALSFYINARRSFFDIKNIGDQTIPASSNWNIYYLWVDAFNANNYGIIYRGQFTTSIPQNTYQNLSANYTLINYDLAPNASLGQTIMGVPYVSWDYFMPGISGSYYLVLFIDKGNSNETNLTNNVFYVTQTPKYFSNGYSNKPSGNTLAQNKYQFEDMTSFKLSIPASDIEQENALSPYRELTNQNFPNGYTSTEIVSFLQYKIQHGGL